MSKKIFIGSDHAGFELKEQLKVFLKDLGYDVEDKGSTTFVPDDDYPDYIAPVAQAVITHHGARGIVFGGSGQGEAIVANKFQGIRAAVFNGQYKPEDGRSVPHEVELSREHNDANVLSLGARFLNEAEAKEAVELWLNTAFSNEERHVRRLQKITEIEKMLYGDQ